jgi:hypothetical protein
MSPAGMPLRQLIARTQRSLRRDASLALAMAALSALPLALITAWLFGLLRPWSRPGYGPLLLELAFAAATCAVLVFGVRRWLRRLDETAVAADAERQAGMPEGTVRGVLELSRQVPAGTSDALARRAEEDVGRRFAGVPPERVAGELGRRVRRRRGAAAAALSVLTITTLLLGFAAPDHSRAAWAPLTSPVRNLAHPPLPALAVTPGDVHLDRGSDLDVRVLAPGRSMVTIRWQSQGEVARAEVGVLTGDSATVRIAAITAATEYWAEAPDGAVSPRYRVTPVDPLLVASLNVDVIYPAHAARAAERFSGEVPPLDVPEGTQLVIDGRATRPLGLAELGGAAGDVIRLDIEGAAFSGTFTPAASGIFAWRLADRTGGTPSTAPAPLQIRVLADEPPTVRIHFPETDTILDASLRTALVAEARDDHGLTSAAVTSWRVDRAGRRGEDVVSGLPLSGDESAMIRTLLDGRAHELLPGDTLKFFITVTDNSPRRQTGVSRTVALRLPGMAELRERSVEEADRLVSETASMAREAARLHDATRTMERRTAAANARRAAARDAGQPPQAGTRPAPDRPERMDFADAAPARQLLEEQESLLRRMEALERQLENLERSMQESALHDAELQQRLAELRKLQEEMLTPELKKQLEQLRRALEELDPEALQKALENVAREQEQSREQLEQSLEAMRRAADEQRVNNLAQEARELATKQQALSQAMGEAQPTPEHAAAQRELARQAGELARELGEMRERLEQHGDPGAAEQLSDAGSQVEQAGQQMQQAARDAARQDGATAAERGQQAAEQLERTADALEQTRRSMAESRRQEAQESVQQAAGDALALAERQQDLLDRMRDAETRGSSGDEGEQEPGYDVVDPRNPPIPRLPQPPQPQVRVGSERERNEPGRSGQQPQPGQPRSADGQQQGGQQQGGQQQGGQQQGGQQQGGQQQGGQQQGGQQQGGQQQGGQQQGGQQQGGQQQGGAQGAQSRQGDGGQPGGQAAGPQPGGRQAGGGSGRTNMDAMRSDQAALQQGLQQLNRNLQEAAERRGAVSREVSSAMARANRDMQQAMERLQRGQLATEQAQQAVESLNRLALALLNDAGQMAGPEGGSGGQQSSPQLADLAKQQGSLAGQSGSLAPMNLSDGAMSQQLERLAQEQLEIAKRLGSLSAAEGEEGAADAEALAREAAAIARMLASGTLQQEAIARQERLFHRLLDAGRTLEKDELDEERAGESPGSFEFRQVGPLDARLFGDPDRFRMPSPDELRALPSGYRRLILDYFERLNRPAPPTSGQPAGARGAGGGGSP